MSQVLDSLPGVVCHVDDILVYSATEHEHDSRLTAMLQRLQDAVLLQNVEKCQFSEKRVQFLGHVIDQHGVHADPENFKPILEMLVPLDVSAVRRFLVLANQLAKFVPNLAETTKPLLDLSGSGAEPD